MILKYAVHAYAWTQSWTRSDVALIDHAAALGLDAIEIPLMELEEIDPPVIRTRAEVKGIDVIASLALAPATDPTSDDPAIRRNARDYLERCVDFAAEMGAPLLTGVIYGAVGGVLDQRPSEVHYERAAEVLRAVGSYAVERKVSLAIEPINRYETFLVNTVSQGLELAERVGNSSIGLHLDAYHMNIEEDDFYRPTLLAVPRLMHFHLSESHRGIPGRGTVNWRDIFRALHDGRYEGFVGLESFAGVAPAMAGATRIWRDLAPDSDTLVREGLSYLKELESEIASEREANAPDG